MRKLFLILLLVGVSFLGFAQNADNLYLDVANYASIDEAGWNHSYVNALYKFQEYRDNDCSWLTLPVYGAFIGAKYDTESSSDFNSGHPQTWIDTNITSTNNICSSTKWFPTSNTTSNTPFWGSVVYFSSSGGKAHAIGNKDNTRRLAVYFYVTNIKTVKLLGVGDSGNSGNPIALKIYECAKNDDGSLTTGSTPVESSTNNSNDISRLFTLTCDNLEATKIYKVEASVSHGYLYEIAFKTSIRTRDFPVNISQYGASTLYVDFPLEIPYSQYNNLEGVYYVKSADGGVAYTEKLNDYIPANTGVIVQGVQGTYIFKEHIGMVAPVSGNLLRGSLMEITPEKALADANASSTSVVMTLAPGKNNDMGFYKFVGEKLKANMAYLIYDRGEQSSVNSLFISGMGAEFSNINNVNAHTYDGAWYTLQGVRLNGAPKQRGIYIRNGKAVVVK